MQNEYCWACQKEYILSLQHELMTMQYQYKNIEPNEINLKQQSKILDLELENQYLRQQIASSKMDNYTYNEFQRVKKYYLT